MISFTLTLWVTPNQTPSLKREVFSGTILGHPKHVLHFVPSPSFSIFEILPMAMVKVVLNDEKHYKGA